MDRNRLASTLCRSPLRLLSLMPLSAAVVFIFPDVDHWSLGSVVNNDVQSYILHTDGKKVLWG